MREKRSRSRFRTPALSIVLLAAASPRTSQDAIDTSRVVCVSKQINELVYAIGAQDHLVGRDLTSVYPKEIEKLTSVGY